MLGHTDLDVPLAEVSARQPRSAQKPIQIGVRRTLDPTRRFECWHLLFPGKIVLKQKNIATLKHVALHAVQQQLEADATLEAHWIARLPRPADYAACVCVTHGHADWDWVEHSMRDGTIAVGSAARTLLRDQLRALGRHTKSLGAHLLMCEIGRNRELRAVRIFEAGVAIDADRLVADADARTVEIFLASPGAGPLDEATLDGSEASFAADSVLMHVDARTPEPDPRGFFEDEIPHESALLERQAERVLGHEEVARALQHRIEWCNRPAPKNTKDAAAGYWLLLLLFVHRALFPRPLQKTLEFMHVLETRELVAVSEHAAAHHVDVPVAHAGALLRAMAKTPKSTRTDAMARRAGALVVRVAPASQLHATRVRAVATALWDARAEAMRSSTRLNVRAMIRDELCLDMGLSALLPLARLSRQLGFDAVVRRAPQTSPAPQSSVKGALHEKAPPCVRRAVQIATSHSDHLSYPQRSFLVRYAIGAGVPRSTVDALIAADRAHMSGNRAASKTRTVLQDVQRMYERPSRLFCDRCVTVARNTALCPFDGNTRTCVDSLCSSKGAHVCALSPAQVAALEW